MSDFHIKYSAKTSHLSLKKPKGVREDFSSPHVLTPYLLGSP